MALDRGDYRWYVEPQDSHTNRVLAENTQEENCHRGLETADGKKDLWECSRSVVRRLVASSRDAKLKFNVYSRRGNGQIRNVNFLFFSN